MASNASVPSRGLPPKPPDKGSFPLDHFGECSDAKKSYMACLRENTMATQSDECRVLSAAYLKCRMDRCAQSRILPLLDAARAIIFTNVAARPQGSDGEGRAAEARVS